MPFPSSFAELLIVLTTSVVGLGAIEVMLGEFLWRMFPAIAGKAKMLLMLLLPFVLALLAYAAEIGLGSNRLGVEELYSVLFTAGQVAFGGQLLFGLTADNVIKNTRPPEAIPSIVKPPEPSEPPSDRVVEIATAISRPTAEDNDNV